MKYLHVRVRDEKGNVLPHGGVTVAYEVSENVVFYALARCSKRDVYCKKTGRAISTGRFDKFLPQHKISWIECGEQNPIELLLQEVSCGL